MQRPPAIVGLLAAVVAAGALVLITHTGGGKVSEAGAAISPLTVVTKLPDWRAPGARVTVGGFAGGSERVVLRANGRAVAHTTSGRLGRYGLGFAAARPGRYRLVVAADGRTHTVGTLVVRDLVLEAVGDITFGEQVGPAIAEHGPDYPWALIAPTLRRADITTGNLETSVSTRGVAAIKEFTFRGAPSDVPALRKLAGFDVLTLANNHAVDYGREALLDTIRYVRAAGIQTIGAGANDLLARRPAIVDEGGLKVAFLGYSDVNPVGFTATAVEPGTAAADVSAITADVHKALRRADLAVCFFHWGVELHPEPDARQEMFASACLNAGAKLVLGAHPHVFGPVSRPGARTLVAWTLGNFLFPSGGATARTAILRVQLDASGVRSYRLLPVEIDGFRPRLAGRAS
ncbi:MAG TPA: CapA family protein [Gaiellaceae bacterium]|nr:CapA family protein [Gaiellaceae bacterium]